MQKRISHKKSRRGCLACKRRHIKVCAFCLLDIKTQGPRRTNSKSQCDEQGPPCANCLARNTACDYVRPEYAKSPPGQRSLAVPSSSKATPSPSTTDASSASGGGGGGGDGVPESESRRLLELELMHRWCTRTFRSVCGIPEEEHYVSTILPREALQPKYHFVLHGMFAVAALDLSHDAAVRGGGLEAEAEAARYENLALEYFNRGSAAFRAMLSEIPRDSFHMMYMFASPATVMVLGLPEGRGGAAALGEEDDADSALGRVITLAELYSGTLALIDVGWDALIDSNYPFRSALSIKVDDPAILEHGRPVDRDDLPYRFASLDLLEEDVRSVLARLDVVNDVVHGVIGADAKPDQDQRKIEIEAEAERADPTTARHTMYATAIFWVKEVFAEAANGRVKGYCLAFFALMGADFVAAARAREPVALFILLHFAVQLDHLGREAWWAEHIGRRLVREISDLLRTGSDTRLTALPEGRDGIAWARQQVALPP